jgi:hypothetical protein
MTNSTLLQNFRSMFRLLFPGIEEGIQITIQSPHNSLWYIEIRGQIKTFSVNTTSNHAIISEGSTLQNSLEQLFDTMVRSSNAVEQSTALVNIKEEIYKAFKENHY